MPKIVTPSLKINNAKPKDKLYKLADGGGLALWIYPNNKKVWRLDYKRPDGKRDSIKIGEYPTFTLSAAREFRENAKLKLTNNLDIKAEEKKETDTPTLNAVFPQWFERWQDTVSSQYSGQVYRALNANILSVIGNMPIDTIKPRHIV